MNPDNQNCIHQFPIARRIAVPLILVCLSASSIFSQENTSPQQAGENSFSDADLEFFENKVRPILVDNCLQCHGADESKIRGGLRLTSREEMLTGGDSGPAIVPGHPDQSLLIQSIRFEEFEMPPSGQLKQSEIDVLVRWIEINSPDPRKTNRLPATKSIDIETGRSFWAFSPRESPQPPKTVNPSWPKSSIDQFILSRLDAEGIEPAPDANRETLIRRACFAIVGLPPTPAEIDAFVDDPADLDEAFSKVVDRLLRSPRYGERWGRHWLDVVRFAESSGGGRSLMFPDAWRFRDYVINSFNADKPFNQFVKEQIAGDLLEFETHDQKIEQIVATGMLALGPTNYEQQDKELLRMEVIDEQVDTVGRAFLGLTLGCARCHDHKFDPIPMTDYYAMAGIFGSTQSLVDGNVSKYVQQSLATERELADDKRYRDKVSVLSKQLAAAKKELADLQPNSNPNIEHKNRSSMDLPGIVVDDRNAKLTGDWIESTSTPFFLDGHYLHDSDTGKGVKSAVFSPQIVTGGNYEVRLAYSPGGNRASNTPVTIDHQDGQTTVVVNQSQAPPIDGLFVSLGSFRFEADNQSTVTISTENTDGHVIVDAIQFLRQVDLEKKDLAPKRQANEGTAQNQGSHPQRTSIEPAQKLSKEVVELQKRVENLDLKLKQLKQNAPRAIAVAMSVKDSAAPTDGHLHIRGSVRNLGPVVTRGFISVCCQGSPKPDLSKKESGRLQLAEWIASPEHPLTARVYVNRIWRHLFGTGLVSTTDNFGLMGERPSHPELLDFLAEEFVEHGWSNKWLIREIMLSHVYQLSPIDHPEARQKDDANRLLWRANRRRVDAEVLRDSILFVSGELDLTEGGLTIRKITEYDLGYQFDTVRRSVYVPVFRNSMLDLFEVFDFANPNLVIGHRNTSTLPTQALFLMNSPLVIEQSRKAAKRLLTHHELNRNQKIEWAFRQTVGRRPSENEVRQTIEYLDSFIAESTESDPQLAAWSSFYHTLFASLDFRYVE